MGRKLTAKWTLESAEEYKRVMGKPWEIIPKNLRDAFRWYWVELPQSHVVRLKRRCRDDTK